MPGEWMDVEGGRAADSVGEAAGPAGRLPTRRDSLARALAGDIRKWGQVMRSANIKLES